MINIWIRDESKSKNFYHSRGARPFKLTSEEQKDRNKRTSLIGELYVAPGGEVKYGDAVCWELPIKLHTKYLQDAADKANARILHIRRGDNVRAEGVQVERSHLRISQGEMNPNDAAPGAFTKEN
jgi:hypothetical protein